MPSPLLSFHQWLISDPVAVQAYRDAISQRVRPGDIVLDLGAGTGILAYQACAAGAARVYAVECSEIAALIPQLAEVNGLGDRIAARKAFSFDVCLPEKADVIIASMVDAFGIGNNFLAIVLDARRRLLRPGGAVIPSALELTCGPVELPEWYQANIDCWNRDRSGFSFRPARAIAINQMGSCKVQEDSLLAAPQHFPEILLADISEPQVAFRGRFRVERPGILHAVAGWFRATMADGVTCGNSPLDPAPLPWNHAVLPVSDATPVQPEDHIEVAIRAATAQKETIWSWDVLICGPDGACRAEFHHSTFHGLLLAKEHLAKRASNFVPALSDRGKAELAVLEMCDGKRALREISNAIRLRFPKVFESTLDAQTFAAAVLERLAEQPTE